MSVSPFVWLFPWCRSAVCDTTTSSFLFFSFFTAPYWYIHLRFPFTANLCAFFSFFVSRVFPPPCVHMVCTRACAWYFLQGRHQLNVRRLHGVHPRHGGHVLLGAGDVLVPGRGAPRPHLARPRPSSLPRRQKKVRTWCRSAVDLALLERRKMHERRTVVETHAAHPFFLGMVGSKVEG